MERRTSRVMMPATTAATTSATTDDDDDDSDRYILLRYWGIILFLLIVALYFQQPRLSYDNLLRSSLGICVSLAGISVSLDRSKQIFNFFLVVSSISWIPAIRYFQAGHSVSIFSPECSISIFLMTSPVVGLDFLIRPKNKVIFNRNDPYSLVFGAIVVIIESMCYLQFSQKEITIEPILIQLLAHGFFFLIFRLLIVVDSICERLGNMSFWVDHRHNSRSENENENENESNNEKGCRSHRNSVRENTQELPSDCVEISFEEAIALTMRKQRGSSNNKVS